MTLSRSFSLATALLVCGATATAQDLCTAPGVAALGLTPFDSTAAADSGVVHPAGVCTFGAEIFQDVYYTFTPAVAGNYEFDTFDGGFGTFDTKLAVYDATTCPVSDLNLIACNDDNGNPGNGSGFTVALLAQPYLVRIGSFSATTVETPMDLSIALLPPPPANDDCALPVAILALGLTSVDLSQATGTGPDVVPATCDSGSDGVLFNDLFFTFTPAATGSFDIQTQNNGSGNTDTKLAIYDVTTCPASGADVVVCDDDNGPANFSMVRTTLMAGTTYLIRVGTFSATSTINPLDLSIAMTPPPPAHDACAMALAATVGLTAIDNEFATLDGSALDPLVCDLDAGPDERIYNDLWYTFIAPTTDSYDFDTDNGTNYDTRIAIYSVPTCPAAPADVIACDDDTLGTQSFAQANLTMGLTYLIRVGGDEPTESGTGFLTIGATPPPPANDDCVNAIALTMVGVTPYDSAAGTLGSGLPLDDLVCDMGTFGDEQIYRDVWYSFTPTMTDFYDIASINNGNPVIDSRLAVYNQAACPDDPALVIACDDDAGPGLEAAVTGVSMTSGTTYIIRLGTFAVGTDGGPAALSIAAGTPPPPPPANDDCATAAVAMVGVTAYDNTLATTGTGLPLDPLVCDMGTFGDDQIYFDLWYTFTPGTTDVYDISSINNGNPTIDSRVAVYNQATCPDNPALVIACDDDSGGALQAAVFSVPLTAMTTYTIRVGVYDAGAFSSPGPAGLEIIVTPPPPVPPANDDCANAEVITAFGTYAFDNSLATTDSPDLATLCDYGFGDDINHNDVWFEYTPTVGGCTYISTLNLAGFDTRIAIYDTATCPVDPMTWIACSDEEVQPIGFPFEAGMDVDLVVGTTYMIHVGNFTEGGGGPASLLISAGPVAVNNLGVGEMQSGAPGCAPAPIFADLCNGNGDVAGCGVCPCGNFAPSGTIGGCLNRSGFATRLHASGDTSVSLPTGTGTTTDLRFNVDGLPPNTFGVLISGDAVAPTGGMNMCTPFNSGIPGIDRDGLRCAVMSTFRHGGRSANLLGEIDDATGPSRVWGGESQPHGGIFTQGGFSAGQTRFFQLTHREDSTMVCGFGLNTSQAVEVTFTP